MATKITPEELAKSMQTYRKDLLQVPFLAMKELLDHVTVRTGIRYKDHVGKLYGDFQMGNYDGKKMDDGSWNIKGRTFQTYFGNLVANISPNEIYESIYGSNATKGDALKNVPIVQQVAMFIVKKIWENTLVNTFTAKHDAENNTETAKWFDGFCEIIAKDKAGTNERKEVLISEAKGNLKLATADSSGKVFTKENAEDVIKDFFWTRDAKLRGQKTKLFMNDMTYHMYTEAYQTNHGSLPYNQNYDKRVLEGASQCEIVPLSFVPEDFLLLTPKSNIFCLFNNRAEDETYIIKESKSSYFDVAVIATAFFGTQFEDVDKEMFSVLQKQG